MNTYFSNTKKENLSTAILHIHGGGFISMSSFIHQTYTRNWANSLEVPILSVDYGKAPEYPYPNGLYDCL
jgi:hormone-sensitive lipase